MQEFDPRQFARRCAPRLIAGAVAFTAAVGGWQFAMRLDKPQAPTMAPAQAAALQHAAFTRAETQGRYGHAENVPVEVRPGETLEGAVRRAGVAPEEARQAVATLARAMDTVTIKAGLAFQAAVVRPAAGSGEARLVGLSMRTGPATSVTVSRTFDGALRLRAMEEKVRQEITVADGEIQGSLYESAAALS